MLPIFLVIPTKLIPQTKKAAGNILEGGVCEDLLVFAFREQTGIDEDILKNLLMPLFLMGCFPGDFQEGKRLMKAFGETAH